MDSEVVGWDLVTGEPTQEELLYKEELLDRFNRCAWMEMEPGEARRRAGLVGTQEEESRHDWVVSRAHRLAKGAPWPTFVWTGSDGARLEEPEAYAMPPDKVHMPCVQEWLGRTEDDQLPGDGG